MCSVRQEVNSEPICDISKQVSFLKEGQTLLANIAHVLTRNNTFNEKINTILQLAGKSLDVSRVYIFEDDLDRQVTNNTFEWCNTDITPQIDILQDVPFSIVNEWYELIGNYGYVHADNIRDLPESIQAVLAPQDIVSIVVLKLPLPDQGTGFVGLDECFRERAWQQSELDVLISITGIIASLYENDYLQKKLLSHEHNYMNMFNTISDFIFVADLDGYFLQVNHAVKDRTAYADIERNKGKVHILDLHPNHLHQKAEEILMEMLNGMRADCPLPLRGKYGQEIPVETSIWLGDWDGKQAVLGISKDLTEVNEALDMFNKLFENNPLPIVVLEDRTHILTKVNNAFLELFGFAKYEVLGKRLVEIGILADSGLYQTIGKALQQGESLSGYPVSARTKQGKNLNGIISGSWISTSGTMQFLTVFTDLTEQVALQQQLEQNNSRMEHIIESTELGTWEWNWETGATVFNERWAEMIGYTLEELGETDITTWYDLIHPDDKADSQIALDTYLNNKTPYYSFECRMLHKDGRYIWIRDTGKVVEFSDDGKPKLMFGSHLDITNLKLSEQKLLEAKKKAEDANKAKSDFLAMVSHEIRTPVHTLQGITELLEKTQLNDKQRSYSLRLQQSSNLLLETVDNVLDFSKLEMETPRLVEAPFFLHELLENLKTVFSFRFAQKGLDLVIDIDPEAPLHLMGDAFRVKQILQNLLSNAEKYTKEGVVTVHISTVSNLHDHVTVEFSVVDSGIGMDNHTIEQIFTPYFQGTEAQTATKFSGSGLGLPIVKQLVELLSGEIIVESLPGKGSTFTVRLPFIPISDLCLRTYVGEHIKHFPKIFHFQDSITIETLARSLIKIGFSVQQIVLPEEIVIDNVEAAIILVDWPKTSKMLLDQLIGKQSKPKTPPSTYIVFSSVVADDQEIHTVFNHVDHSIITTPASIWSLIQSILHKTNRTGNEQYESRDASLVSASKLLVCDDHIINRELVKELLSIDGYEVDSVDSGMEVIRKLQESHYDLLLLDLQMPGMDGFETATFIRERLHDQIPIIAFSAHVLPEYEQKCYQIGMNGYLVKPVSYQQLSKVVESFIGSPQAIDNTFPDDITEIVDNVSDYVMSEFNIKFLESMERYNYNIKSYMQHLDNHISELQSLQKDMKSLPRDASDYRKVLHALRGVASNLGAMKFANTLWQFETSYTANKNGQGELDLKALGFELKKQLAQFKQFFTFLTVRFENHFPLEKPKSIGTIKTDVSINCDEMRKALEIGDVDFSLDITKELLLINDMDEVLRKKLQSLLGYLESYDFHQAVIVLNSICQYLKTRE
jgi:PAS domain S-box-containing protein